MPAGLTVVNDSNVVQIDENFRNLVLQSKQTVNLTTRFQTSSYTGTVTVPTSTPCVVAVASPSTGVTIGPVTTAGVLTLYGRTQSQATVYVFCPATSAPSTVGLQVFNAAGEPVFDSGLQYMRVTAALQIPDRGTGTDTPYTYAGAPTGTYAVVVSHFREFATMFTQPGLGLTLERYRDFYTTTATGFTVANQPIFRAPGQDNATYTAENFWALKGSVVLLIDVAGL